MADNEEDEVSGYNPFCPFCSFDTTSRESHYKHLSKTLVLAYMCEQCCIGDGFQCDAHKTTRVYATKEEVERIKAWRKWYGGNMEWSEDFEFWYGCDYCLRIDLCNPDYRADRKFVKPKSHEVENHVRTHLQYFTTEAQKENAKADPRATVVQPIRKLESAVEHRIKCIQTFVRGITKSPPVTKTAAVNGGTKVTNGRSDVITLDSSDDENMETNLNGHANRVEEPVKLESPEQGRSGSPLKTYSKPKPNGQSGTSILKVQFKPDFSAPKLDAVADGASDLQLKFKPDFSAAKLDAITRGMTLKVSLERIPEEKVKQMRVIRDPSIVLSVEEIRKLKKVEKLKAEMKDNLGDEVEKRVTIPVPQELQPQLNDDQTLYMCIFCVHSKLKKTYDFVEAKSHYCEHLNYYPYQCEICLEVKHDEYNILQHFKSAHPDITQAPVLATRSEVTEKWLNTFLAAQQKGIMISNTGVFLARNDHCVVCDANYKNTDVQCAVAKKSAFNLFERCMKHMHYVPYHCLLCEAKGVDVRYPAIGTGAYTHVMSRHPEALDSPLATIYKRSRAIKILDKFLAQYFLSKGKKTKFTTMKMYIPLSYKEKLEAKKEKLNESVALNSTMNSNVIPMEPQLKVLPIPSPSVQTIHLPLQNQNIIQFLQQTPSTSSGTRTYRIVPQPGTVLSPAAIQSIQQQLANHPNFLNSTIGQPTVITPKGPQLKNMHSNLVQPTRINVDLEPSVFDEELTGQAKKVLPDFNYFCVFCKEYKSFTSAIDATKHYGKHLDYRPITCLLCSRKFEDIESVKEHHEEVHIRGSLHPDSTLLYIINEDENIEKWVTNFLLMQKEHKIWRQLDVNCLSSCVVCDKLFHNKPKPKSSKNELSEQHVYQHLNYMVYECILCEDQKFSFVGENAISHLKKDHNLDLDQETASTVFRKTHTIPKLEQLVHSHIIRWKFANGKLKRKVLEPPPVPVIRNVVTQPTSSKQIKLENVVDSSVNGVKSEYDDISVLSEEPAASTSTNERRKPTSFPSRRSLRLPRQD